MPLTSNDRSKFADMLGAVGAMFGRDVTPALVALYWNALLPYDLKAVRQAFDRHVKNPDAGQFMPKPADLIRMLDGSTQDSAMAAWAKVERAMRSVGGHESVVFDDPVTHRCISDMGGWPKLCETMEADLPFRARDFQTMYRGYAMRREIPSYPAVLVGRFEAQNRIAGQKIAMPVMVGDVATCRLVAKRGTENVLQITRASESAAAVPALA